METVAMDSGYLDGSVDEVGSLSSNIVRVFLSSTFSDMAEERNMLLKHAYPRVKDYAMQKYGVMFQVVDMRWGVTSEAQNDHMTSSVCLKEIRNCQRLSIGPNFVALIGQKYGYRPIPAVIDADEFEAIYGALSERGDDVHLLDSWYTKDDNSVPAQFILQPITSRLPHYDDTDDDLKRGDQAEWNANFEEMRAILKRGADLAFNVGSIGGQTKEKYYMSVTEEEIQLGVLQNQVADNNKCLCFLRNIDDLHNNISHYRANKFIDIVGTGNDAVIDKEAQFLLKSLREKKIAEKVRKENIVTLSTRWNDSGGINAIDNKDYLDRLCELFCEKMISLIDESMKQSNHIHDESSKTDVIQSLHIRNDWSRVFFGREDMLNHVQRYLTDKNNRWPIALYGESGCGKTALIAKCSKLTSSWMKGHEAVTVTRFLGTSPQTSNIMSVLQSICQQISVLYKHVQQNTPSEFKELVELFHSLLKLPASSRPLVIYLDSMDQLASSFDPYNLRWLPAPLPENVKVVISFIPTQMLQNRFQSFLKQCPANLVPIPQLGDTISMEILQERLRSADRTITQQQEQCISDMFSKCSLPLFSRIIVDEVLTWKSYSEIKLEMISSSVRDALNSFFERLEQHHGRILVRHALAYITASRNGVSEVELLDLLSLDDDVLNSIFLFWLPPTRRIPPFLWTRLKVDLDTFLVNRAEGDMEVMSWYHRQFTEVSLQRYMQDEETRLTIHGNMAEYFLGVWSEGRKKPFVYSPFLKQRLALTTDTGEADRNIPDQPLQFRQSNGDVVYNKRKLSELPYHLVACRNIDALFELCIFNYLWLWTKISVFGLQPLIEDLNMTLESRMNNEVQLVTDALRIAGSTLNTYPNNLSLEITGRLMNFYSTMPKVRDLIIQSDVQAGDHSAIVAPFQVFELPITALSKSLEGTRNDISDIVFVRGGSEIITFSASGILQKWNVKKGEIIEECDLNKKKSIQWQSNRLRKSRDDRYILCLNRAIRFHVFIVNCKSFDVVSCHTAGNSNIYTNVVASCDHVCMDNAVFELATGRKMHSINDYRKVKSFVTVAFTRDEEHILIGGDTTVELYTIQKAKKLKEIPVENSISRIELSEDGRLAIIGTTIQCNIHIYDISVASETFGQKVITYDPISAFPNEDFQGYNYATQEVSELRISNKQGAFISLVKCKYPIIWSLKNVSTKPRLLTLPKVSAGLQMLCDVQFSADDKYVMARAVPQNIYMWDAITGGIISVFSAHPNDTHRLLLSPSSNIAVTTPLNGTSIKIWDITQLLEIGEYSTEKDQNMSVDSITLCNDSNYAFISRVQHQKSMKSYHFMDYFSIDVLDLTTGGTTTILPYDKYGQLQSVAVSKDASTLVLTLGTVVSSVVNVVNMKNQRLMTHLTIENCKIVKLASKGEYLAIFTGDSPGYVSLYSLLSMTTIGSYNDCVSGLFTDSCIFVGITSKNEMLVRETMEDDETLIISLHGDVKSIHYCSASDILIMTVDDGLQTSATVYKTEGFGAIGTMVGVSGGGICDVANDGSICIDADLHIFELQRCKRIKQLKCGRDKTGVSSVKLSKNGEHAVFIDSYPTECVKVCRVADSHIISQVCLHSVPEFVTVMPSSDIIMAVGKDRHLFIFALMSCERTDMVRCNTLSERHATIFAKNAPYNSEPDRQLHVDEAIRESIKTNSQVHQAKNFRIQLEIKSSEKHMSIKENVIAQYNHETFKNEENSDAVNITPVRAPKSPSKSNSPNTLPTGGKGRFYNAVKKSQFNEKKSSTCNVA